MVASVVEMNDASGKGSSSSCLAIIEKKSNQRSGGCIGIFFQLFDWNRKLTKKRFFSKKLLPPARAKQGSSKKFKGDEKMPKSKLHLIANENNGGFPKATKGVNFVTRVEQKREMRVPSLVAKLMGLESVPASQRDKSNKSSFSDGDGEKSLDDPSNEADLEIGVTNARHDSRPQKLQKTGAYEKRAVTRFGAEALQIQSVFSQVRKYHHHHPKHISPLKSPRVSSRKSASQSSRLIEAATKIFEPGLQVTSRAKCSLTNGIVTERVGPRPADIYNESDYDASVDKSLVRHTSCKNCRNLLDVIECRPGVEISTPIVSDMLTGSSLDSAKNERSFVPSHENDVVLLRSQEKIITLDENGKKNAQFCNESTPRTMPVSAKWDSDSSRQPHGTLEGDEASSFAFKHNSERLSSGSRTSNMQEKRVSSAASTEIRSKNFVALNRNLSGRTRMRSPARVDYCKFDLEKKPSNRQDNCWSHLGNIERKRRTPNVSQVEGTDSVDSVTVRYGNVSSTSYAQGGKRRNFVASSPSNYNVKCKQSGHLKTDKINDNNVVSSTSSSSTFKRKIVMPDVKEETRGDDVIKTYFQRSPILRADALSAFLEQKLKELSSRENDEMAIGGQPQRSSAMILQELISVLNSGHLICSDNHMFNDKDHKYEAHHVRILGYSCIGNHLSPGSVLEASFSSSSLDEGSGRDFHPDSMNCSYDQQEQLEHDAELLDSTASFNMWKIGCETLTQLVNRLHRMLQSLNFFWPRLTESKLNHMKEVLFDAEFVLGIVTRYSEDGVPQLFTSCILLDKLDTMVSDAMWIYFNGFVDCEGSKKRSQLKGFLIDCVIEFLESNLCQHYYNVFKLWSTWTKLPLHMKAEMLVQEVKSEIDKWACKAGMVPDQIIEWEMSHSLGKWTDFNIEAFEVGVDIDWDVLQVLVDEIVEDLVDSTI